jgi:ribosomal protein L29
MKSSSSREPRLDCHRLLKTSHGILRSRAMLQNLQGRRNDMSHLSMHDIDKMSMEQMLRRLEELREELLQLRAQQALGGSSSNPGEFKQTRRSIARLLTSINSERKE